jgi:acyl-CoA synthetase (AMP-forming)/AMP-acid ligase II
MLNAEELNPFLIDMKPALLFVHSVALEVVRAAATLIGLPHDRIVLLDSASEKSELYSLQELVDIGLANKETHRFEEFRLKPGGGKTKVALYFPSSGTTVVPKMAAIPHASIIANILQNAAHDAGTNELTIPIIERRFRPGDASLAGESMKEMYLDTAPLTQNIYSFTVLSYVTRYLLCLSLKYDKTYSDYS